MKKVAVFGNAAAGKSTLAKKLAQLTRLPIIDGYGSTKSAWERFAAADTLIYIDLPVLTHLWWVTKRFFTGFFVTPEGWPKDSPIVSSSLSAYRVVFLCNRHLTPRYRKLVAETLEKRVHHLKSPSAIEAFLQEIRAGV